MKNNPGKYSYVPILFLILGWTLLQAEDFTHTLHIDKPQPYVKEAVILTLDINQTNPEKVLLFNFSIAKSDAYTFQRLDTKETNTHHNAQIHYIYLIYPLKSGNIDIGFNLLKKVTTDESVAYSFSGDRDNVKGLVTVDTNVNLPPLRLKVKKLPEHTLLVGDFSLIHSIKTHQAQAYEPLPLQVDIKGKGFPPLLDTLLPAEGNFTRFIERPIVKSLVSTEGTQSTVTYSMALSSTHSFTLDAIKIKAFNPHTQKSYILAIPQQHFDITTPKTKELIDTIDSPAQIKEDWSWMKTFLGYLVVFSAGYLCALSWKWTKKHRQKEISPLKTKIQNCNNEKALLQLLISIEDKRFASSIEKLEDSLYGDGKIQLNKMKQDLLEKII